MGNIRFNILAILDAFEPEEGLRVSEIAERMKCVLEWQSGPSRMMTCLNEIRRMHEDGLVTCTTVRRPLKYGATEAGREQYAEIMRKRGDEFLARMEAAE